MTAISFSSPALSPTPQTIAGQLITSIGTDQSQIATLQEQISTGTVVNQPSDNPALAADVMTMNSSLTRAQQYVSNAADGQGWLQQGTSTLNQVMSALQSITSAVESVSGQALSGQTAAVNGIAAQVASGLQQILGLANTTYNGQAIFAGTGSTTQAFDSSGTYQGNSTAPSRTVAPGTQVTIAQIGSTVFGNLLTGAGVTSGSVGVLQKIVNDLRSGNLSLATGIDLQHLQTATATVANAAATLGANYQNMQAFSAQATATQQALQTELGNLQDTNLPKAATQLTAAQNSYQAALWATSQISQQSLVQFLG
ncbi:MAG: flagellin [Actinomycetota bacterium]|nr:flagellin [Actinomycetota bacterium]